MSGRKLLISSERLQHESPTPPGRRGPSYYYVTDKLNLVSTVATGITSNLNGKYPSISPNYDDPASEFKDDVFPLRPQDPWDISTDFPYPRTIAYDVEEGTWLRLDVHPISGDIVFDMAGDIYCLPAYSYSETSLTNGKKTRAVPVLTGVPHDTDPSFSPEGDRLAFRSDAGFGVDNIWAIAQRVHDASLLGQGVRETEERRLRRLSEEGRLAATYNWVSDARWHPSGTKIIATKWYFSKRSLGAGEGWEYEVPRRVEVNSGKRLVSRVLPLGWTKAGYSEQQIGHEQFSWLGNDTLVYSGNTKDVGGNFEYSKDVHQGIYSIFARNLTFGEEEVLVDAFPGGASRPTLSRDGRTLAFVRRVRDKEALVLKDLQTGTLHHIWHGLTYDLSIIYAPMGTYPSFAFDPSDEAILIWATGQIYHIPLALNAFGERMLGGTPQPVGFRAHLEVKLAETLRATTDVRELEKGEQRLHAFTQLALDETGTHVVFQAAGVTYIQALGSSSTAQRVPVAYAGAVYYSPSFVGGNNNLIIHGRWSDTHFSFFELANLGTGNAYELTGLPMGRYFSPVISGGEGAVRTIAFVKTSGDLLTGDVVATAQPGLWIGEVTLPIEATSSNSIPVTNVRKIGTTISPSDDALKLNFISSNELLVHQSDRVFAVDLARGSDEWGRHAQETLANGHATDELVFSNTTHGAAFVNFQQVYYAPEVTPSTDLWSKPGKAPEGLARLSLDGGHDLVVSGDGSVVGWFLGPFVHTFTISRLEQCSQAIKADTQTFGVDCVTRLLDITEVTRLRREARAFSGVDTVAFVNATILTMEHGDIHRDLISGGTVILRDGFIDAVGKDSEVSVPAGALIIQTDGGYITPGFIDAHAHWDGMRIKYPAASWEMETFLAYGVTTMHNPSSHNSLGFVERARVESGLMIGPRIFQTGQIIYGASDYSYHLDIATTQEAKETLTRIKAEGGPASWSYKNYNLPARASRQRLLLQARKMNMACVPEGVRMTTVEHNIPVSILYDDILTLYLLSGTGSTPTHIVNYGGPMGEQLLWATTDIPNDPKLRRFTRHDILEGLSESTSRPANSMALFNVSSTVAKLVHSGLSAHIGGHGESPLGLMYHQEMAFAKAGGLSNYEVIRAATSDAATTFGLKESLGTVSVGKLADLVIFPGGFDLIDGDIHRTKEIRFVARGGRIWEAKTMTEVWPVKGRQQNLPPFNAE
ncbi:hypothetical protein HD554DRAFT_2204740 [Boletus coccyginus]|nr:hypothetical protein HD554DRAFT_2204740 [Boletus coccyginus]